MTIEDIINFIYFIADKVDPVYELEVNRAVKRFIKRIENYKTIK